MSAYQLAAFGFPVEVIPAGSLDAAVAEYRKRHPSAAPLMVYVVA